MGKIEKQEIEVKYNIGSKPHKEGFGSYAALGKNGMRTIIAR